MGMNALIFQMKRAHLASMKAGRFLLRMVRDMTPARFDIMLLLRVAGMHQRDEKKRLRGPIQLEACCLAQSEVVKMLGLHKSTVSEALTRLEELGWVEL